MLKGLLLDEKFKALVIKSVKRSNSTREVALIIIEQEIPCSLHMNTRIMEKFVKMMLQSGINNNINSFNEWITQIEQFVNTSIYDKGAGRLGYWKIPINIDKNNVIIDVSFKGNYAEKVLRYSSELIDTCLARHELNSDWKEIIIKYNLLVTIINTKENLSEQKLDEFHEITCEFYDLICTKIGYHYIINYLHMLGA